MEPDNDLEELRAIRERFKSAPPKGDLAELQQRVARLEKRFNDLESYLERMTPYGHYGKSYWDLVKGVLISLSIIFIIMLIAGLL